MMKRLGFAIGGAVLIAASLHAQQPAAPAAPAAQQPQVYMLGNPLGLPINPAPNGSFNPMSSNVKVYGAIYSAESCSYDPDRGVIVVPNRGVPQNLQTNNAWISFINHDGSVHTARWIGIANPGPQRTNSTPPLDPQRAARQRHRQRHAVSRRSRRRHRARAIHRCRSCGRST